MHFTELMFEYMPQFFELLNHNRMVQDGVDGKWDILKNQDEDREIVLMLEIRIVELLCEVLNGNGKLCRMVGDELIEKCCEFLIDIIPGYELRYLRCLQIIIVHSQNTNTKKRCIEIMIDKLLDRNNNGGLVEQQKIFVLAQEPTDDKRLYFTRLISLFAYGISAEKSWGKFAKQDDGNRDQFDSEMNALSTVVVRLQGVLNIEWILDEIDFINSKGGKDQSWRELEASYIQLLNALQEMA